MSKELDLVEDEAVSSEEESSEVDESEPVEDEAVEEEESEVALAYSCNLAYGEEAPVPPPHVQGTDDWLAKVEEARSA